LAPRKGSLYTGHSAQRPACRGMELRRRPAPRGVTAHSGQKWASRMGLPSVSRNPHGNGHRTVQKTEQPVLAGHRRGRLRHLASAFKPMFVDAPDVGQRLLGVVGEWCEVA